MTPRRLAQRAGWWAADYAFALHWQVRAAFSSRDARRYETGERDPVVVIPGIWETWGFMRPLIEKVHAAGHPVFVISALRHNARPVAESAELVSAMLVSRNLKNVLIVAHSKGGLIGKYAMAFLDDSRRISRMVAVCAPFSGSGYAAYLVLPALRALSPSDATMRMLAESKDVNARIVSVYGEFDPHIPEGSGLTAAHNVMLPTGGHFRILAQPEVVALVLGAGSATEPKTGSVAAAGTQQTDDHDRGGHGEDGDRQPDDR
ncbi:lipase family protein [Subtercola endophyticus]|uniref:alpha/beta hydrolase n=1 Tax=Subtercola endophyticus TaxID=2895559 RepID=UPI001E3706C7|nr:alpha/beta hydrolase [Subtercola endophyticus]UFS59568.1 alpha/beta hydrolase [Subtercola endophyticus]